MNFVVFEVYGLIIFVVVCERVFFNNDVFNRGGFNVDYVNSYFFEGNCVD